MKHPLTVVLVTALAVAATACSRSRSVQEDNAFQWTNQLPAGAVVHLRDGTGDITVRRAAGQTVLVNGTRRWRRGRSSDIKFAVNQVGNDYYVCAMWSGSGKCGAKGYHGRQTGGLLTMFSLFHRTTDASADFIAEIPANVVVDAKTANGSVHVDGASAGVTALTSNGTITASNVSGPLMLKTTNGDVRLSTDSMADADSIHLTTTNGTIHAELPASMQGAFDLSVMNGSVRSDLPLQATSKSRVGQHLAGQIGASTRIVKMRTMNGNVSVVARRTPASH